MSPQRLAEFGRAWQRKDLEALLELMTDDVVYSPTEGRTFRGKAEVSAAFEEVLAADAGVEVRLEPAWMCGDRALAPWSYTSIDAAGTATTVRGVDLFELEGDRISRKDVFRKTAG